MTRPASSLRVALERDIGSVRRARALVGDLMMASEVPSETFDNVLLAVSEAVSNAVVHGGGPFVDVSVRIRPTSIEVRVGDGGEGYHGPNRAEMPEPDRIGGRGLPIMAMLVDELQVLDGPNGGTEVVLRQSIPG